MTKQSLCFLFMSQIALNLLHDAEERAIIEEEIEQLRIALEYAE